MTSPVADEGLGAYGLDRTLVAPREAGRALSPAGAALAGWLVVAMANSIGILRLPSHHSASGSVRLVHLAVDLGHTLAIGLVVSGAVALFTRFAPKRAYLPYVVAALASIAVFQLVLTSDLEGAVDRWTESKGGEILVRLLCAALALVIPSCMAVGRLAARPRWRALGVLAGVCVIALNDVVLVNGYPGGHVWIAACGATLLAAALRGMDLGAWLSRRMRPIAMRIALACLSVAALASVVFPPPGRVLLQLLERDTAFLAPTLTALHAPSDTAKVEIPRKLRPWYEPRTHRAVSPPSPERLLPDGPIVLFITIDALRYEVLSPKYRRTARTIQDIRAHGVSFTQARSPGSDTRYALAAVFAGRYFSMLKWTGLEKSHPTLEGDMLPRFPELLKARGVETASGHALPKMLASSVGILKGFSEEFVTEDGEESPGTPKIVDHAIERLKRHGSGPFFFYAHLLDPHAPYSKHGKPAKTSRQAYMAEVGFADEHLGRLRKAIRELGLAHRTMLIVSADHGEAFGEHRLYRHNKPLYDVMVRVPLLVEFPGAEPRTVDRHVSLMDVGPTVLDVFGVPTPGYWMAESLVPHLRGKPAETHRPIFMERRKEQALLFADGVKALARKSPWSEEIYDLKRDPDEENNLRDELGAEGERRIALVHAYAAAHAWVDGAPKRGTPDSRK
jgi:arylsulfatase A-like enzyme